ncbi:MAG: DUF6284 family protein [Actinomycetota bacterium]
MTVCLIGTPDPEGPEPTPRDLWVLERERPVLEAELAVVAAECAYLARPSELARARVRRAATDLGRLSAVIGRPMPAPLVDLAAEVSAAAVIGGGVAPNRTKTTTRTWKEWRDVCCDVRPDR